MVEKCREQSKSVTVIDEIDCQKRNPKCKTSAKLHALPPWPTGCGKPQNAVATAEPHLKLSCTP
jgi:hypothetical protein